MPIHPQILKISKDLLSSLTTKIPKTLFGIDRLKFIGTELINSTPHEQRNVLLTLLNNFLIRMRELEASDIDMGGYTSKRMIWLRIHGAKKPAPEFSAYDVDEFNIIFLNLLTESQKQFLYQQRNLDFSYSLKISNDKITRYRADVYVDLDTLALNMRAINTQIRPYESFGFHQNITRNVNLAYTKEGLILVTGITGSGKSTTLDSIIDLNNRSIDSHIIIIAAPIEFVHDAKRCIIRHREVGRDTLSFKQGTIEALRQDPDIIVIGEMRDPDTIMAALEVADSGHKVLSTLHTSSAVESIDRIIAEVPPIEQDRVRNRLADVLKCVISQKLIPSRDGKRALAKELMLTTPSIKAAIKNNNTSEIYQMISEGSQFGLVTMEQDLMQLYLENKISLETAYGFANNKRRMQQLIKPLQ